MPKLKALIISNVDEIKLAAEINRIGIETFNGYEYLYNGFVIITIHQALTEWFVDAINEANRIRLANGKSYQDLTRWELLGDNELLMVYNAETNIGRALTPHELEERLESDGSSLTPAGIRRWYENRKVDSEFLLSDSVAVFWIPEDV